MISDQIDDEIPISEANLKKFVLTVREYLKQVKTENVEALRRRSGAKITAKETFEFFRSQERINNTSLILQYLLAFLVKLPLAEQIQNEQVDPFEQFKLFVGKAVGLLKERDVRDAILAEQKALGVLNPNNEWYYKGRIDMSHKEISKLLDEAKSPVFMDYKKLFLALKKLSKFWFSQRNEKIKFIRKSDIYLYKLAAIHVDRIDFSTDVPAQT